MRLKVALGMLSVFLVLPIWFFLLYRVLVRTGGGELDFFLLWVYIPVLFFVNIMRTYLERK